MEIQRNPAAGNKGQLLPYSMASGHFCKNIAPSIVSDNMVPQILVPSPNAKNKPPMASDAAAIQANNPGANENGTPNFATSSGNQAATWKRPNSSVVDHGIPNLLDPNSKQSINPPRTLGIAIKKLVNQELNGAGFKILLRLNLSFIFSVLEELAMVNGRDLINP